MSTLGAGASRLARAWRALPSEQRLAAGAALALLVTMILPWYSSTKYFPGPSKVLTARDTHSALSVFTFVEAAVLLTSLAVLALLFARAERRAFHLPGGDGTVVTVAGGWALLLVVWRLFDKPGFGPDTTVGLAWGILGPLLTASALAYAGTRMRGAHRPEPPISVRAPSGPDPEPPTRATEPLRRQPARARPHGAGQLTMPLEAEPAPEVPAWDDLTRPHGSEPPLPPPDFTDELGDESAPRGRGR